MHTTLSERIRRSERSTILHSPTISTVTVPDAGNWWCFFLSFTLIDVSTHGHSRVTSKLSAPDRWFTLCTCYLACLILPCAGSPFFVQPRIKQFTELFQQLRSKQPTPRTGFESSKWNAAVTLYRTDGMKWN